ncbi:MAG TPA: phasin family protein [Beijerinckiaceae bacterium]|nr:phasin family protein [Rhodoblastus sp.]MCB9999233.1 phasin family protein [Methylobacteriaceae bacterium]MCO5088634.1 phasin family protein [Methylobacteriaceae bacterium]HPG02459.1 phasin family protein [Rhodoblastus sp.]HRY03030.1 phasin family protein [Beijerinckiaceae bacterium]
MAYDFEAFQKFGKEQFEAASAAMGEVAKGLQAIATEATDYSKKSFADSSALVEKLVGVKKLDEAITLQTDYAKSSYEGFVAQATKMGEMYQAVAKEAFKPVEGAIAKMQAAAK